MPRQSDRNYSVTVFSVVFSGDSHITGIIHLDGESLVTEDSISFIILSYSTPRVNKTSKQYILHTLSEEKQQKFNTSKMLISLTFHSKM